MEPPFNEVPRDWGNLLVISRFCSIHFTVTLAGLKDIVRYTKDFVIKRFVKLRFHCIFIPIKLLGLIILG